MREAGVPLKNHVHAEETYELESCKQTAGKRSFKI